MGVFGRVSRRQLLVVTGKGGVGKSAVAAALGMGLARRGQRVLLLESDPRETLHELLGVEPSGGAMLQVRPRLTLQNVQPVDVIRELVREHLRMEIIANRVTGSPVFQHFVQGAPGLKEMAVLTHAMNMLGEQGKRPQKADIVVLDAPATGHGISLLAAPRLVTEVIQSGPFGDKARELATWIDDPQRAGVVVVTFAEEMPVQEAIELRHQLRERAGKEPELLVVNGLYPPFPEGLAAPPAAELNVHLWRRRRQVNDCELERLESDWNGPRVELPLLPLNRGPRLVEAIVERLSLVPEAA